MVNFIGRGKGGKLKLDFMAKSIGIHFFEFEDMFRCYKDNENLKKTFWLYGHFKLPIRELKQTTTTTAMRTPSNKRFNEQNNGYARAL